jgi:hypothetical protein
MLKNFSKLFCTVLLFTSLSVQAEDNPYTNGGSQYGSPYNGSQQMEAYPNTASPYSSSPSSNAPSVTPTSTTTSYQAAEPSPQYSNTNSDSGGPIQKVGDWWTRKRSQKTTGQPELDLANQRILSGKARIKAVKAREKLQKHIVRCKMETDRLTQEAERAEEQARLIENQVKFQEANMESVSK